MTSSLETLQSTRLDIRYQRDVPAEELLRYRLENKEFLEPWEPGREASFYEVEGIGRLQQEGYFEPGNEAAYRFAIVASRSDRLLGLVNFTNMVGFPFHACNIGFSVDEQHQGQGYMTEALALLLPAVFREFKLNRIMANFMPRNFRSARLLSKLGFQVEGFAKSYLKINGVWEDHILTSLLRSESGTSKIGSEGGKHDRNAMRGAFDNG